MNRNTVVATVLAVIVLACLAPVAADEADADTTVTLKISDKYVYAGTFVMPDGEYYMQYSTMMFIDGSEGHRQMEAYIADPLNNSIPEIDDEVWLRTGDYAGTLVHAYTSQSTDDYPDMNTYAGTIKGDIVLEPFGENLEIAVRPGEDIRVSLISSSDESGNEIDLYISHNGMTDSLSAGSTFYDAPKSLTTYSIGVGQYIYTNDLIYIYEISYEGGSEPNGSATMFAAICFVIAALTIGILVYAAMKPKWAK